LYGQQVPPSLSFSPSSSSIRFLHTAMLAPHTVEIVQQVGWQGSTLLEDLPEGRKVTN
jgi:hypothetical protein